MSGHPMTHTPSIEADVLEEVLEPCPWHGDNTDLEVTDNGSRTWWVVCNRNGCGCEGPWGSSAAEARRLWNRRSRSNTAQELAKALAVFVDIADEEFRDAEGDVRLARAWTANRIEWSDLQAARNALTTYRNEVKE